MSRGLTIPGFLLALVLVGSGTMLYQFAMRPELHDIDRPHQNSRRVDDRVSQLLDQFVFTESENNLVINVFKGDSLVVNPRRVGLFNVKNVNEITVSNARYDVYFHRGEEIALNPFSTIQGALSFQDSDDPNSISLPAEFGVITRQVVNNLVQNIYHDKSLDMVISSRKVYVDNKDRAPVYLDANFTNRHTGSRIFCKKAIWNKKEERFRIPGVYVLMQQGEQKRGHGISLDLDFTIRPLRL